MLWLKANWKLVERMLRVQLTDNYDSCGTTAETSPMQRGQGRYHDTGSVSGCVCLDQQKQIREREEWVIDLGIGEEQIGNS